ncbi:hypothetical protein BUALT_Bualt04G0074900 [Buddleja alternifolia]|uniref:Helitron helicase-like domain-containing protein n=1 Tax=Buddleja alternifolia TaxID=168488 RepID=A0AAV6XV57_9LAMI|nr:hypothetical protein BUALT_Bualt04G0074900 [Buddleja alternifolia]
MEKILSPTAGKLRRYLFDLTCEYGKATAGEHHSTSACGDGESNMQNCPLKQQRKCRDERNEAVDVDRRDEVTVTTLYSVPVVHEHNLEAPENAMHQVHVDIASGSQTTQLGVNQNIVAQRFHLTPINYNSVARGGPTAFEHGNSSRIPEVHMSSRVDCVLPRNHAQDLHDSEDEEFVPSSIPVENINACDVNLLIAHTPTVQEKLAHSSNINPKFGLCCQSGKVNLPLLPHSPPYLDELLKDRKFMENIRSLNSMFCFTSMGGKVDKSVHDGRGPPCFKISGENYHRIGSLLPPPGRMNSFVQLYICDAQYEIRNRLNILRNGGDNFGIDNSIVEGLKTMLDNVNPYVQVFRSARDALQHNSGVNLHIRILHSRSNRQYTRPTSNEIAALIVGDDTNATGCRDIIVCKNDGYLKRISETHPSYTPLQYPILFPYGTDGWRIGIPYSSTSVQSKEGKVSMREFWAFRFQHRELEGTTLLQGGRLFNQLAVDCFAAIEQMRLNYIKTHQAEMRADLYQGVHDTMLTKWFEANRKYVEARTLTYVEFPTTWVWKRDKKEWVKRKQGKCIGRLPYAHANSGERYYLQMLLYKVRGAQCYEDIRTFNGVIYPTFKQACSARGLLDDDNEWHAALSEAST